MPRLAAALVVALALVAAAFPARAQRRPDARSTEPIARRAMPRFDGRAPERPDALDALAWVPRALLYPVVLTLEGLRIPSRAVLHSHALYEAFGNAAAGGSFDHAERLAQRRRTALTLFPTLALDWGRRPSVGAALELESATMPRQRLSLDAAFGGERYYVGDVHDRVLVGRGIELGLRAGWWERPDNLEYGAPGPDSSQPCAHWFWMRRAGGSATASVPFSRELGLYVASGVRWTEYDLDGASWLGQGTGYAARASFAAWVTDAELRFDSRGPVPVRRGGVRLVARVHHGVETQSPLASRWVTGELHAGVYLEVMRRGRVLGLEALVADSSPMGGAAVVPFSELPTLGGDGPMRGFLEGRFRGPSVAAASLVYRWPIWLWLEAETRVGVGNAFGADFAGLAPGALFGSWSVAVRTLPGGPAQLELLFGLGSSRFDAPRFEVESARILAAVTRAF